MSEIKIDRNPSEEKLRSLGLFSWPIWTKGISEFPWTYDEQETCYFLEGNVVVTPQNEKSVEIGKGDLVTFPQGMSCIWKIRRDVRKHYRFG